MKTRILFNGQVETVEFLGESLNPKSIKLGIRGIQLYVLFNEFGATHLVGANSMDEAMEIYEDTLPEIEPEEIHFAYGFETPEEYDERIKSITPDNPGEYLDLVEGYSYCSNAEKTGVISLNYNIRWLRITPYIRPDWLREYMNQRSLRSRVCSVTRFGWTHGYQWMLHDIRNNRLFVGDTKRTPRTAGLDLALFIEEFRNEDEASQRSN